MFYVTVDIDECNACGDCVTICPNNGFILTKIYGNECVEFVGGDGCNGCESCVAVCPTETLSLIEV
jgi:ferredoxin